MVKAADSKSAGLCPREFESHRCRAFVAQLAERSAVNRQVPGSIPGEGDFFGLVLIWIDLLVLKNWLTSISSSISIVVSTPRCGRGNPGSNPGYCSSIHGLVGYDDRLTRGRSPVQFRVDVFFFSF